MKFLPINVEWSAVSHFQKPDRLSRATIGFQHNFGIPKPETLHTVIGACGAITTIGKMPVIVGVIALGKTSYDQYRALEILALEFHPDHPEARPWLIEQAMEATKVLGFQYLFRRRIKTTELLYDGMIAKLPGRDQPALDV